MFLVAGTMTFIFKYGSRMLAYTYVASQLGLV